MGRPRTEDELVEAARGGDAGAYEELVRRHQEVAFRTAYVITRSAADAEEAAQDAFVKAYAALGRFCRGAPLRPWPGSRGTSCWLSWVGCRSVTGW